jgi:hydrogenase-4 component F
VFCACLLTFDAMLALIAESHHLGLMWVGLEAATLSTAPMLYFNHSQRSLEAVWKYLLIGSVGIALALLGSLFLAYSALRVELAPSLLLEDLLRDAPRLSKPWLHSAFVILFVGYGTKMGLAPMHTWKPDAYGEAPGIVGTLLAGGLTNCAFLAIVRFSRICHAAGDGVFARHLMLPMGLLSMAVAGAFMARQRDFKRMLAYSSVEHMGILMVGLGLGGAGVFGALLHMINNGLTKGVQHPPSVWKQDRRRRFGSPPRRSGFCRPLPGGLFRDHGIAALRAVPERVHDRPRRFRREAVRGGRALSRSARRRVRRNGRRGRGGRPG